MLLSSLISLITSHSSNVQQSKDVSSLSFGLLVALSAHPQSENVGIDDAKLRQGQRNHIRISTGGKSQLRVIFVSSPCARQSQFCNGPLLHSEIQGLQAVEMHSHNSNMSLTTEIAFNGVLSVETTFLTKVLCISIALLRRSLAHGEDRLSPQHFWLAR